MQTLSHKNKKILLYAIIILMILIFSTIKLKNGSKPGLEMVSGTEYISGEEGQIIVRIKDKNNQGIIDAECKVSLLYPDKSYFLIDKTMLPTSVKGNYYHSFTTPQKEGIYEEHIICNISGKTMHISSSFHVSTGLNMIVELSRSQREQYNAIIERLNESNKKITSEVDTLNEKMHMLEKEINRTMNTIPEDINKTIEKKFNAMNSKFAETAKLMSEIFTYT